MKTRLGTILGVAALVAAAAAFQVAAAERSGAADRPKVGGRPNVVLIMSDDMGFSDLGCYGGEIQTPNLDGLAAGGLRFAQFYNTARCCPTRASLLTGLHPHQAGVGHMMEDKGLDGYLGDLNPHCVTIAEVLKAAGYGTYMAGKWHVTKHVQPDGDKHNWPLQRGFDRFYGTITGAGSYYDPATLTRDNAVITPRNDKDYQPDRYYYTDAISDNAVRFLRDHRASLPGKPFFLYVAYTAAHWPMHALPEDVAKYRGKYDAGYAPIRNARYERLKRLGLIDPGWALSPQAGDWEGVAEKPWEARCMEVYAAMIDRMDRGIGRIVAELKEAGQLDNTLILFLQDNGGCAEGVGREGNVTRAEKPTLRPMGPEELQRPGIPKQTRDGYPVLQGRGVMPGPADTYIAYGRSWANVSNTPFREYKHWVHEGGIATPLVAHWPAGIRRRGELERQPGQLVDIMATCVDVSGAKYPTERQGQPVTPMEGRSLVPAFEGRTISREALYWEHEGNRAIRVGRWKLVAKSPAGKWELYDMERDRTELHDLAEAEPERVRAMAAQWEAWAKRSHVLPWPWKPPYGQKARPAAAGKVKAPQSKPNVILILTDDQGYGDLSCHGNPILKTPNLDRLHDEGRRFTDFHVSPTCAPTRSSLMTGRHEFKSGVTHTIMERERMSLKATTLAEVLKSAGYTTGIFGKWHLGDEPDHWPDKRGFDEMFIHGAGGIGQTYAGSCGDAPGNRYFDPAILHNGKFEKTQGYCTDVFFGQALKWIETQKGTRPFFAYITPNAPHAPLDCPEEYEKRYADKVKPNVAKFFGMIANIDDNVGRLLTKLKEWDIERDTLVIFMNDNGGTAGVQVYNAGMRAGKGTPYNGGTRAASFWRWPGTLPPGNVDKLAAHVDVLPTLAELVGAKIPDPVAATLDGRSLVPLLKDPGAPWPDRYLFTHVGRWERGTAAESKYRNCSVRSPRYNLVSARGRGEKNWELYDLQADPGEKSDVAAQHPDVVRKMEAAYDQWWASILPCLENEDAVGPKVNPFKELYWKQFGGGPETEKPRPEKKERRAPKKRGAGSVAG